MSRGLSKLIAIGYSPIRRYPRIIVLEVVRVCVRFLSLSDNAAQPLAPLPTLASGAAPQGGGGSLIEADERPASSAELPELPKSERPQEHNA